MRPALDKIQGSKWSSYGRIHIHNVTIWAMPMSRKNRQQRRRAPEKPPVPTRLQRSNAAQVPANSAGRRKQRLRNRTVGARVDLFDPRHPGLVPSVTSEGHAFPIVGATVSSFIATTGSRSFFVYANTGNAGTVAAAVNAASTPSTAIYTVPLLADADDAGGPTSGRAMKGGLTFVNRTQLLDQGGQVVTLNCTQRVRLPAAPSLMTQAQWNTFMDTLVAHPMARIFSGTDFRKSRTLISHPLDSTDYLRYTGWHGTFTLDQFFSHIAIWPGLDPAARPMSSIFVIFEAPSAQNTYEFKTRSHFYTRWPLDTVPGQAQRAVPTAPASVVNQHRDHAAATAHIPRGEEAGVAAVAAAAGAGAGWLANATRLAVAGAQGIAEGLELAAPLLALA